MDTDPLPDDRADALRHDIKALEHDAEEAAERTADYLIKRVAVLLVGTFVVAFLLRRRARRRRSAA